MPLKDFTLSNARQFNSSVGNTSGVKGLMTSRFTQKLCAHYIQFNEVCKQGADVVVMSDITQHAASHGLL